MSKSNVMLRNQEMFATDDIYGGGGSKKCWWVMGVMKI